jgi:hypothetical protein
MKVVCFEVVLISKLQKFNFPVQSRIGYLVPLLNFTGDSEETDFSEAEFKFHICGLVWRSFSRYSSFTD